jgi:hypothetical protein
MMLSKIVMIYNFEQKRLLKFGAGRKYVHIACQLLYTT